MESSDTVRYLGYYEAVVLHIMLMRRLGERNFGVADRPLIESALARPHHAADLENADLIRQAATLCYGLIKNHPWVGANKRTATILVDRFLHTNGMELRATVPDVVQMALAVDASRYGVDELDDWYRRRCIPIQGDRRK